MSTVCAVVVIATVLGPVQQLVCLPAPQPEPQVQTAPIICEHPITMVRGGHVSRVCPLRGN